MKLVSFSVKKNLRPQRGAIIETASGQKVAPVSGGYNDLSDAQLEQMLNEINALDVTTLPDLDEVTLHNPLPTPGKIICIGLNFMDHVLEVKAQVPTEPVIFSKWHNTLAGPTDEIIVDKATQRVDYEAELAFVIGKTAYQVKEENAFEYIAGYLCSNDVSARDLQFSQSQWVRGKSLNGFCPLGPYIATRDEIADPHNLRIQCRVNGQTRQDSNTAQLIFKIPALVAFLSDGITLEPGDVVLTGTPPGVGFTLNPPRYLQPGDVCEVEIEGLGMLRNLFVVPAD
ncbi:fumarylacetoacetate hydrolase family protein [Candidatus Chlorohelix sp.]|uniref:fumarylacetoacetate hydrolase family protein n=1 Tax=Candidatus Chlorohelix sp. TaxID=3139201 RepID=UPI00306F5B39